MTVQQHAVVRVGMDFDGLDLELFQPTCPTCTWEGPSTFDLDTAKLNARVHNADRHGSPRRIQRLRTKGWRMPRNAVYVGRLPNGLSGWGNPFVVSEHQTAAQAVDSYRRALLEGRLQHSVATARRELAGSDLACWCPLNQPCHADVLLELANGGPT